jgi:hypothetical protein
MMESNDNLQSRLDTIRQWGIDWALVRDLAVLNLVDLCALSVGVNPRYAWLVTPEEIWELVAYQNSKITPEEIKELAAYHNGKITEMERRVAVAVNHVKAGTLPIVRNAAFLREDDPYEALRANADPYEALRANAEKTVVKIADFSTWAIGMGWELPDEFPQPNAAAAYPVAPEELHKWPWGDHETELLRKLADAAQRFWTLYDPTDETTAPTNKQVTQWLVEQGVATRVAEIMAQILRPDGLRTGPR